MKNLVVQELAGSGNFERNDPCPQALRIRFMPSDDNADPEIALLWAGLIRFHPQAPETFPSDLEDIREENVVSWDGALSLVTLFDHTQLKALKDDITTLKN